MAHFKIYTCLIVLIAADHGIIMTEGRLLKSMKKQELDHNKDIHGNNTLNLHQKPLSNADNFQDSPADGVPSASLPVAERKATFPQEAATQTQGHGNLESESVNDFRPTTPGNSPGVGHSFIEHGLNSQSKALGDSPAGPQTAANGDDFQPMGPGHSPNSGHSKQNQIAKPNA